MFFARIMSIADDLRPSVHLSLFVPGMPCSALLHLLLANGYSALRNTILTDRFCGQLDDERFGGSAMKGLLA